MNTCIQPNLAIEIAEGLVGPSLRRHIDTHVATCENCRRLLAALARTDRPEPS